MSRIVVALLALIVAACAPTAVRGADLAPLFRYQPGDRLPAMFEETRR